jgi:dipeptidyl aminopeptidase/acylaminoacyl peptidase
VEGVVNPATRRRRAVRTIGAALLLANVTVAGEGRAAATDASPRFARIDFVDVATLRAQPLPRSIRSIEHAGDVIGGPAGERLAFDDRSRIYVAKVDGTHLRPITDPIEGTSGPSWSPDGRRIVFTAGGEFAAPRVFVVRVRDGALRQVAVGRGEVYHATFRANGRRILFTRAVDGGLRHWTVRARGGGAHMLPLKWGGFGAYSPTNPVIAFRRTGYDGRDVTEMTNARVWFARADGTHVRSLGGAGGWMSQIDPQELWPAWSPDGTRIVHQRLYGLQIVVNDLRTGERLLIGVGAHPNWLDADTLIIEDFQRKASLS